MRQVAQKGLVTCARDHNERILSVSPIENWPDVVRDSFENDAMRLPGGESGRKVLKRAWSALGDFLEAKSEMPLAVTHGNLMGLVLHSVDSTFGFDG
ncbi:MAG: histidine phosphatase family protein [Gammaproteobacteria bacterium]|nr:histidine phosphatase family protein [Gammaproteobacteria bacterium]